MNSKAVVAMSGGVDSSVAAALMVERGYRAVGVTLKLLPRADTGFGCCGSPADIDDAKRVCESLDIPHYTLDLADLFEDKVIRPFIDSYLTARTPNPCVECNRSLKFGYLLGLARAWETPIVATGHYARVRDGRLYMARDDGKDQSYFLHSLTPRELGSVEFPIGDLTKAEVRAKARELGLKTADKPESQEICFVPRRDYRGFIDSRVGAENALRPGPIKDTAGRSLGSHNGLASYTIGQRKGLGAGAAEPRYVVRLEPDTNTVVVGSDAETLCSSFTVAGVSWTAGRAPELTDVSVRIRHRHAPAPAAIEPAAGGEILVRCARPQRAVTAGQAAVFYAGEEVLGGGVIASRGRL